MESVVFGLSHLQVSIFCEGSVPFLPSKGREHGEGLVVMKISLLTWHKTRSTCTSRIVPVASVPPGTGGSQGWEKGQVAFPEGGRKGSHHSWLSPTQLLPFPAADPTAGPGRAADIWIFGIWTAQLLILARGPEPPAWIRPPLPAIPSAPSSLRNPWSRIPVPAPIPVGAHPRAVPAAAPGDPLSTEKPCWCFLRVISLKGRGDQSWRRPVE